MYKLNKIHKFGIESKDLAVVIGLGGIDLFNDMKIRIWDLQGFVNAIRTQDHIKLTF